MAKCAVCPAPAVSDAGLCSPHYMDLAHRIMNAEPEPSYRTCKVCSGPFRYTEARVLRHVMNPGTGSRITPYLCWVCAHLYSHAAS